MVKVPLWDPNSVPYCHYLASPYTHKDSSTRELRYLAARDHTAQLLAQGLIIYSPIVHCHDLAKANSLPYDASFWTRYNFAMLARCDFIRVLKLPGWKESKGVKAEVGEARRRQITEVYDTPGSLHATKLQELAQGLHDIHAAQ